MGQPDKDTHQIRLDGFVPDYRVVLKIVSPRMNYLCANIRKAKEKMK